MRVTIESTDKVVDLIVDHPQQGKGVVKTRVWQGATDGGIPVYCFVAQIAVAPEHVNGHVREAFRRELMERVPPRGGLDALLGEALVLGGVRDG